MTEEDAIVQEMLRRQFQRPLPAGAGAGAAASASAPSKNKPKSRSNKEKDAGENGVSMSRPGTAGTISSSSPAPRRVPTKETVVPIPGVDTHGGAGDVSSNAGKSEKRKKKSGSGAVTTGADARAAPVTADHDGFREVADEPKRKRARKSKGGADEPTGENAGERERERMRMSEVNALDGGTGSSRKSRKRRSEGGK